MKREAVNSEELLNVTTELGHLLLYNGAEIYRVEESMQRVFSAYQTEGDVFVIPTCIYATVSTKEGRPVTRVRRLYDRVTNLDKVARANDLCRRVCRETPDFPSVRREIKRIDSRPAYGFWPQVLAFALVSFSFTLFYGGTFPDACCALFCGALVKFVCSAMDRCRANTFFTNIAASCAAASLAVLAVRLGLGVNLDKIVIGALMNLVPGIVITSFMRDIMAGDLVAGLVRFVESLLVATAIALGAGLAIMLPRLLWGV